MPQLVGLRLLRAATVVVALGFLVAYVIHSSDRAGRRTVDPVADAAANGTSMVFTSSKVISQPVFSVNPADGVERGPVETGISSRVPPRTKYARSFADPVKTKRLPVLKTYKLFIGGAFPRSESGRVRQALAADGRTALGNFAHASRKDFRDAVVKARAAQSKWAGASAYLRGQILYRAAEVLECRRAELETELKRATGKSAAAEVTAAIDVLVHYAGWVDKYSQLFSAVNPVASPHFNFTFPEPTGVVAIVCPDTPALLGLVGLLAPAILSGNTVIVLASERHPLPSVAFAEIVATSDLPGGVVNILTGLRAELAPQFADHMDVNAVIDGSGDPGIGKILQSGSAVNLKRFADHSLPTRGWAAAEGNPYWILDTVEQKTAWHPMSV